MRVLVIFQHGIGDFFCFAIPAMRGLAERGDKVSLLVWGNPHIHKLALSVPFIEEVIDGKNLFHEIHDLIPRYDALIPDLGNPPGEEAVHFSRKYNLNLLPQFENSRDLLFTRTQRILRFNGLKMKKGYDQISLDWYQPYYEDFKCSKKSILLHFKSTSMGRSYLRGLDLADFFETSGYDVRLVDETTDIRKNLFLIDQVKHIVTVDTSILWIAKALGKRPLCIQSTYPAYALGLPKENCIRVNCLSILEPADVFKWAGNRLENLDSLS